MSGVLRTPLVLLLGVIALVIACAGQTSRGGSLDPPVSQAEITRERAIEIARKQISFQPDNIDAERTTVDQRPVWRVMMRGRLPGQPPGLFETAVVTIDRSSGEVVSVART